MDQNSRCHRLSSGSGHQFGVSDLEREDVECRRTTACRNCRRQRHNHGVNRIRLSTTVDAELLGIARTLRPGITDASLIDEALGALLARHRSAELDASYAAYDEHPADEPDEWGDLVSWRRAAGAS
jgi:hypothetical protein